MDAAEPLIEFDFLLFSKSFNSFSNILPLSLIEFSFLVVIKGLVLLSLEGGIGLASELRAAK